MTQEWVKASDTPVNSFLLDALKELVRYTPDFKEGDSFELMNAMGYAKNAIKWAESKPQSPENAPEVIEPPRALYGPDGLRPPNAYHTFGLYEEAARSDADESFKQALQEVLSIIPFSPEGYRKFYLLAKEKLTKFL